MCNHKKIYYAYIAIAASIFFIFFMNVGISQAEGVDYIKLKTIESLEQAIKSGTLIEKNYLEDFDDIAASYDDSDSYSKYLNGVWLSHIKRYDDALLEFYAALELLKRNPDDYLEILTLEKVLEINEQYDDLVAYQKHALRLRELSIGLDDEIYIKALCAIADVHYRTYNIKAAQSYLTVIFEESQRIASSYGLSRYHYLYGLIEGDQENLEDAAYHFEKSREYALTSDRLLAYDYLDFLEIQLASIDIDQEDYQKAYARMYQLLSNIDQQSKYMKRDIYYRLGLSEYHLLHYKEALNYLQLALSSDFEANKTYEVNTYSHEIYTMLGFVYDAMGHNRKSIESFKNASRVSDFNRTSELKLTRVSELNAYEINALQQELAFKKKLRDANEKTISIQRYYLRIAGMLLLAFIGALFVLIWVNHAKSRVQKKLYLESIMDHLTKVYNRGHIIEILEDNKNSDSCILMMDIDNFKMINDTLGHVVGDKVLIRVANVISSNLREVDAVGRYGGEEFLVVLKDTDVEKGKLVAERIREAVQAIEWREKIVTTISIGMVQCYDGDTDKLLSEADMLMYRAKNMGKNRVAF